jgi:glycosyltransferase involved in cell wall biosynthesis
MIPEAKKILFVDVTGRGGGSNISLRALLSGLDRKRFVPLLVFGDFNVSMQWTPERVYGLHFAGFDNYDFFKAGLGVRWLYHLVRFLVFFPLDAVRIAWALRKLRPAIVHLNCGQAITFGIVARLMGYPVVWHVRELVAQNPFGRIQDYVYAASAMKVVVPSTAVLERLHQCRAKAVRIPNAVARRSHSRSEADQLRQRHGFSGKDFIITIMANSIAIQKGYLFLADVAEQLADVSDVRFVLAGHFQDWEAPIYHQIYRAIYRLGRPRGGEKQMILDRWSELVGQGRAAFVGFVEAEIAIAATDVVVAPSLVPESFGRTIIEANAQGKPAIATDFQSFRELIDDGVTGWLLPLSTNVWAGRLAELASNRKLLEEAGGKAQIKSLQYLSDSHAEKIMRLYEDILDEVTHPGK